VTAQQLAAEIQQAIRPSAHPERVKQIMVDAVDALLEGLQHHPENAWCLQSLLWIAQNRTQEDVYRELSIMSLGEAADISVCWGWQQTQLSALAKIDETIWAPFTCSAPRRKTVRHRNIDKEFHFLREFLPAYATKSGTLYVFRAAQPAPNEPPDFTVISLDASGAPIECTCQGIEITQATTSEIQDQLDREADQSETPNNEMIPAAYLRDPLIRRKAVWLEVLMDSISRKRKKGNYNRANMLSASKANKLALLLYPNTDTALSDNSEYSDLEYILKTVYSNAVGDVFDRIFITLGRTKFMIIR